MNPSSAPTKHRTAASIDVEVRAAHRSSPGPTWKGRVRFRTGPGELGAGAVDSRCAGGVMVSVRDDGRGFDPGQLGPADQAGHFGLRQMRERILDLGGTLDLHSALGQGTELVITLPTLTKEVDHATNQDLDRR